MPAISADVHKLADSYTQLSDDGRTDTAGTLQQAVRQADDRYEALRSAIDDAEQTLSIIVKKKMNYDSNHDTTVTWLRAVDKELKTVEALPVTQPQHHLTLKVHLTVHYSTYCGRQLTYRTDSVIRPPVIVGSALNFTPIKHRVHIKKVPLTFSL